MQHDCRDAGKLEMLDAESRMFCDTFWEHSARENKSRSVSMWLSANRPVLQLRRQRAKDQRSAAVSFVQFPRRNKVFTWVLHP